MISIPTTVDRCHVINPLKYKQFLDNCKLNTLGLAEQVTVFKPDLFIKLYQPGVYQFRVHSSLSNNQLSEQSI